MALGITKFPGVSTFPLTSWAALDDEDKRLKRQPEVIVCGGAEFIFFVFLLLIFAIIFPFLVSAVSNLTTNLSDAAKNERLSRVEEAVVAIHPEAGYGFDGYEDAEASMDTMGREMYDRDQWQAPSVTVGTTNSPGFVGLSETVEEYT